MNTTPVRDSRTLSTQAVYSIGGCLYRYLCTQGTDTHPQYFFEPLPAQRRTAVQKLNRQSLIVRCSVVEGQTAPPRTKNQWTQLSLF